MKHRITVLCENCVGPITGTLGEHGFSALIERTDLPSILFDTGQGMTLLHNAQRMNKDLSSLSGIAISHGHYDHTGGLLPLLNKYGSNTVYAHPEIFSPRYRVKDNGDSYPIGLPASREELEIAGADFNLSSGFRQIAKGVYMTGEIPRTNPIETGDAGLFCDCNGEKTDQIVDDQSLVIEAESGVVVLFGCCHAGVINTLEHIEKKLNRSDFCAVIGGTHLGFCGEEQLSATVSELKKRGIRKVAAAHCTGFNASLRLSREMPKQFQPAMVGYTLQV